MCLLQQPMIIFQPLQSECSKALYDSPVHVVLVSLLVDQLSGLFLFFFGRPNFFWVDQKIPETDQKFPETGQFFFGRPKKKRKRPDNWSTKRLTKTTWTGLLFSEKMLIFTRCIHAFMSNSIKKSWTVSIAYLWKSLWAVASSVTITCWIAPLSMK